MVDRMHSTPWQEAAGPSSLLASPEGMFPAAVGSRVSRRPIFSATLYLTDHPPAGFGEVPTAPYDAIAMPQMLTRAEKPSQLKCAHR